MSGDVHTLLPFLVPATGGTAASRQPPEEWRKVLRSLGTTAPVSVLLPFAVHGVISTLLATGGLEYTDRATLAKHAPVLNALMKPALQSGQGGSSATCWSCCGLCSRLDPPSTCIQAPKVPLTVLTFS